MQRGWFRNDLNIMMDVINITNGKLHYYDDRYNHYNQISHTKETCSEHTTRSERHQLSLHKIKCLRC